VRYGVLADIHGNLAALQAAVRRLQREGVDGWLCAGDLIGYGPHPNECVEVLAELGARCVAGNHELIVLGELPERHIGRLARKTIQWTRSVLRDDCRALIAGLPLVLRVDDLVMTHGSLSSPEEYVTRNVQAAEQLRLLSVQHPNAKLLVVGHTHRPVLYSQKHDSMRAVRAREELLPGFDRFLLNPGSVGQSREREREPRSRFMLIDLQHRWVRFYESPYDVAACQQALHERGLSRECIHVHPGLLPTLERRASRLFERFQAKAAGLLPH
jgi:predicted phosphodiesterase